MSERNHYCKEVDVQLVFTVARGTGTGEYVEVNMGHRRVKLAPPQLQRWTWAVARAGIVPSARSDGEKLKSGHGDFR